MLLGHYLETRLVCCEKNVDETKVKSGKKEIEKVFSYIVKIDDLSHVTQSEITKLGKCGATKEQYNSAINCVGKKISIAYKQKPCEVNIGSRAI